MKIKKIVIISHHFWPENFLINEIALKFKKLNRKVTIITGLPNYPVGKIFKKYNKIKSVKNEKFRGINIIRFPIIPRNKGNFIDLILNYLSYLVNGFYHIRKLNLKHTFDHIFIYSTSPITTALLGIYLKKKYKKKITLWVQDLWPESVKSTGFIKNSLLLYLISLIVKFIYKNSDNIIAQSNAFKKNINRYSNKKINVVENSHFNIQNKKIKIPKKINKLLNNKFCITFAGNIGKAQSIKTVLKTCGMIKNYKNIKIILIGGGSEVQTARDYIKKFKLDNISIFGPYPSNLAFNILTKSKACLLTLKKNNIFSLTIPNKFQTYLYAKKPILVSANGEVAKLTRKNNVGFTSPAENSKKLKDNIVKLYKLNTKQINKIKKNCNLYYRNSFDLNKQTRKLLSIMDK
tara:strand:+ start:121 stop:1335 length:1215 start_codon:yes stop_codon:yes gene_type:complete